MADSLVFSNPECWYTYPHIAPMELGNSDAQLIVVSPTHTEILRFIEKWMKTSEATYQCSDNVERPFRARSYIRAFRHATINSHLVVFTTQMSTFSMDESFDIIVAVMLLADPCLPVRPIFFVAKKWVETIDWQRVTGIAHQIRSTLTGLELPSDVEAPHIITMTQNSTTAAFISHGHAKWPFRNALACIPR